MTNRKTLLPALLSKALVFSLILPALILNMASVAAQEQVTPMVTAGGHTVGLKADGTVVAVGNNWYGQLDVGGWTNVIQVGTGGGVHTVGLKANGTVVAVGDDHYGQCDVGDWKLK